jgi:cytochrome b subunit of formate dehydrogenase
MRGTVSDKWAWTHHPAWYRRATGRDPRADYQRAASAMLTHGETSKENDRAE